MNARFLTLVAGAVGAAVLALGVGAAEPPGGDQGVFNPETVVRATDDAGAQAGVQPQARGPVHEAFAGPTADRPQPGPVVPKQPPELIEELPPAEKPEGDDVQWISGYWSWDEERADFLWVSGIWRAIPPDRQWVAGHWTQVQGGWQWAPGFWGAADGGDVQVVPAPPDPQPETPPDLPQDSGPAAAAPGAAPAAAPAATTVSNSTFVPGNYVYQANQFVWQPGYYVTNRPGFVWVPARYVWTPCGYVFVDGYWDYDLQHRGLLFAPVFIDPQYLAQAGWVYTPTYVVNDVCLLDALFVRPDCGCYFFGDYFDPGYAQLGFVSWMDYRYHRHGYDPLFGYYRWLHRGDRTWERGMRGLYAARARGLARPPRTLAQQQTLAKNLLAGKFSRAALQRSIMLGPVRKVDRGVVKLTTLNRAGQVKYQNVARQERTVSRQREQAENRLLAQGQSAFRKAGTAQALALNLPKSTGLTKLGAGRTPPPPSPVKRAGGATVNATGNRIGTGTGNPVGTKVKVNAGNVAGPQGGGRVNANTTPGGQKVNVNAGNTVGTKVNGNAGNVTTAKPTPGPGNVAGANLNTRVNGNAAGPPGGVKVNTTPVNPAGNGPGRTPLNAGATTPPKPVVNPPAPARVNGGRVTNDPPVRLERTQRLNAGPARVNPTVANPTPVRFTPSGGGSPTNFRVQRTFASSNRPRVSNPTPVQFAAPQPRPVQTFSSRPQRTFSSPPRFSGGGGGGRRRSLDEVMD